MILAAALSVSVLEVVPAQAAPESTTLPDAAFEGVPEAAVPVPAADAAVSPAPGLPTELLSNPAFMAEGRLADEPADTGPVPKPGGLLDTTDLPDSAFDKAFTKAKASGRPVELAAETTETTIAFVQPDGSVRVQAAAGPVRTDVDGKWVDVDTTLKVTTKGVRPAAVTGDITFSAGGDTSMVSLGDGDGTRISLDWQGKLPKPRLSGDTATYRDVLPGVDLILVATRQGFQQHLVVKKRPTPTTLDELTRLEFPMTTDGATVDEAAGDQLRVTKSGAVVGSAAPPVMWDARTDPVTGGPAVVTAIGLDLADPTRTGTDATLVLHPPSRVLTDPATVYPVTIDPGPTLGWLGSAFVQSNIANTPQGGSTELRIGSYDGGTTRALSLLRFDVSTAVNRQVQSATLRLFETWAPSCSPRWMDIRKAADFDPYGVTWNSRPWVDWSTSGILANANVAYGYGGCPANWVNFSMTDWLRRYANLDNDMGDVMPLAVTAGSDTDSMAWKKFNSGNASSNVPTLEFTYDGSCDQYYGNVICGEIRQKWQSQGGANGWLGLPVTTNALTPNGRGYYNEFEHGSIYWTPATGARFIRGEIRDKWVELGAENGRLGFPISDESCTLRDGGCYISMEGGSIHWSPTTGAHVTWGEIRSKWAQLGWETSHLGYPTSDEICADNGCHNDFERGAIYWSAGTGAHNVQGEIYKRWASIGLSKSYLGFPQADESCGQSSCSVVFQNGAIHWSQASGAFDITGAIRSRWTELGGEPSWLGMPTSGPIPVAGGARQEFQGGNIVFDQRTGTTVVGAGSLKYPTQFQRVTQARTQLQASAKVRPGGDSYDAVRFEWRPYSLSPTENWARVEPSKLALQDGGAVADEWLPVTDQEGGSKTSTLYTWNATSSITTDGLAQVRACFRLAGKTDERCTGVTQITVDRAGLTGANATSNLGPGTVGLLTGAYAVVGRDAEFTAPHGGLAATRSFASNDPGRVGPLGPGWRMSLAVDEAGADYLSLADRGETALITRGDGTQMTFVRKSSAAADVDNYVAEGESGTEGATLTFAAGTSPVASSYVLTDLDGDKVTFRRADGGNGHTDGAVFRVEKVEAIRGKAGTSELSPAVTNVSYTAAGNPRLLLAPTDAGVACPDPVTTAQPVGCRALEFVYAGTGAGEKLTEVRLWAHGAAATAGGLVTGDTPVQARTIVVATYAYDADGRLASVTDPRTSMTVRYTYRADGRLASITPVGGKATWNLGYDDRQPPRLVQATLDDGPDGLAPQRTSVRYDVPLDGSNAALPTLTSSEIGRWGQTSRPTDMTAVFGPDVVPDGEPSSAQWRAAQLLALDVNGRVVNTAGFGGTIDQDTGRTQDPAWRISTTEYDAEGRGNVVRQLTAGNRDRALAVDGDAAAEAAQAKLLDTVNVYSTDGVDLLRSYQPARPVVTADGTRTVSARSRTVTDYDKGTEAGHPTPGATRHLPVRTTVDAVEISTSLPAGSTGTEPALLSLEGRSRVTTLEYDSPNAWKFGTATVTRTDPGGGAAQVVTRQEIDEQGRTVASTLPSGGSSTSTAATTVKVYYSATNADSGCVSAAWAGWLCKSRPGGTPSAGAALPTTHVTGYDVYGNVTRTVETGQGVARTTSSSLDAAGRVRTSGSTGTGAEVGQQRSRVETVYDETGLVKATRLVTDAGAAAGDPAAGTGPISRDYDPYGRMTSYTDGSGLVTTQSYDAVGRLSKVENEHGTRTIGYDGGGEKGSLPTSLEVSGVGTFTAQYGADGSIVREELPGGLSATTVRDAAGSAVSLTYRKKAADGSVDEWLRSTATMSPFGQVDAYQTVTVNGLKRTNRYGYDNVGRLVSATDWAAMDAGGQPSGASCTRRYSFDVNSNRTALAQAASAGATGDVCPTSVPAADSYAYDSADRLLPGSGARGALRYDAIGRTRVLPSVDTVDGGGDVALDYYVDDLVASMSQGGRTTTFALDAASRRVVRTDTDVAVPGARRTVSFYSGDDDNPDVVKEPDNSYTRNIASFGGLAAVQTLSGTSGAKLTLQLANLHGDVIATVPAESANPGDMTVTETTEYGLPRVKPATGSTQARYGWLGTHQRDASTIGGLTLMGVRLYAPTLGRFLSLDPIPGGNANPYVYPSDPNGVFDLDGKMAVAALAGLAGLPLSAAIAVLGIAVLGTLAVYAFWHGARAAANLLKQMFAKESKKSDAAKKNDKPSWVKIKGQGETLDQATADTFVKNGKPVPPPKDKASRGARSEWSQIKKWLSATGGWKI
ncbi:hypothetical protein DQ237_14030 [Blastococcus sp. TF02-8]|uniref:DNRLRE domain-containing protein n=1 Tax=Blastococcus sp. TF02-8 TaxID=2250574 RepID=UPI000DEB173C|nr:DNRLRE domain-containing protein [Blastococcus sp. TF02-8]RBY95632.1 hypothetical protein DQ237_14030 [Blastococcus sp. TF02-8]